MQTDDYWTINDDDVVTAKYNLHSVSVRFLSFLFLLYFSLFEKFKQRKFSKIQRNQMILKNILPMDFEKMFEDFK